MKEECIECIHCVICKTELQNDESGLCPFYKPYNNYLSKQKVKDALMKYVTLVHEIEQVKQELNIK